MPESPFTLFHFCEACLKLEKTSWAVQAAEDAMQRQDFETLNEKYERNIFFWDHFFF
jgi:hypothetical protein